MRVLIVEDEFLIAMELEMLLTDFGHEVVGTAATEAEALALAEDRRPEVATVDLRLQGGDRGDRLAFALREKHDIAAIMMSGNLDTETERKLQRCHPLAFIGKPFSRERLRKVLEAAERSRPVTDQAAEAG